MKKQLIFIFTIACFSFIGCKQGTTQSSETTTEQTAAVTPYSDINVETFKAKMTEPNVVILDVRTPEEVAAGKIEGAVELDFYDNDFQQKVTALDKEKTYLVYCKVGGRSGQACELMQDAGFKSIFNLDGGWTAWSNQ